MNVRSITSALDVIEAPTSTGQPITRAELTSFLWFVEMCVMSRAIYFDGTVPPKDIAKALGQIDRLYGEHSIEELKIAPIRFQSEADVLVNARAAIVESSFLIGNIEIAPIDQAVTPDEHEEFARVLRDAVHLDDATRLERALELIEQKFRGSKCAAALVAAGPDALAVADRAYAAHPSDGPRVTGAFINRFRLNYLNQLAGWRSGIYAPDPGFEKLTEQHAKLFKDYLLKRVSEETAVKPGESNILVENMRQATPLPPIGLYSLMLTRERGKPIAVLNTALERFKHDADLQKLVWERTETGLRLRDEKSDLESYGKQVESYFEESYAALDRQGRGITAVASKGGNNLRKWVIPALLSAGAGLIPGVGAGAAALAFKLLVGTATGASIRAISDTLLGSGCNSYLSQYRGLTYDFERTAALARPLSEIAARVEQVFGRPLS